MGKPDFNKKINIVHLLEWVVAVLTAICMADTYCISCGRHYIEMQFIDAATYGILIFMSVVFFGLFFDEDLPEKMDICFSVLAGILNLVAGILVLVFANKNSDWLDDDDFYRLLIGGIGLIINALIFLLEFFLLLFKKDLLQ